MLGQVIAIAVGILILLNLLFVFGLMALSWWNSRQEDDEGACDYILGEVSAGATSEEIYDQIEDEYVTNLNRKLNRKEG